MKGYKLFFGFQDPISDVMHEVSKLYDLIIFNMALIVLGVIGALVYIVFRFNAKRNQVPSTYSSNIKLEVVWTLLPVLILLRIFYPSVKLMQKINTIPESELSVKVVGHHGIGVMNI